jgi:hypothetical protein
MSESKKDRFWKQGAGMTTSCIITTLETQYDHTIQSKFVREQICTHRDCTFLCKYALCAVCAKCLTWTVMVKTTSLLVWNTARMNGKWRLIESSKWQQNQRYPHSMAAKILSFTSWSTWKPGISPFYFHFNYLFVGFEVLTAVVMKISIFWDTTPSSPLKDNRCFGGTCRLHLQDRRISQLFFDPEDGDMFLRNVGWFWTDYAALYPRRWNSPVLYLVTWLLNSPKANYEEALSAIKWGAPRSKGHELVQQPFDGCDRNSLYGALTDQQQLHSLERRCQTCSRILNTNWCLFPETTSYSNKRPPEFTVAWSQSQLLHRHG